MLTQGNQGVACITTSKLFHLCYALLIKILSKCVQHKFSIILKKHTNEDNIVLDKRLVGIHQVLALYAFLYLWIIM